MGADILDRPDDFVLKYNKEYSYAVVVQSD